MTPEAPAIRVERVGCYFGATVEFDGASKPREAWRTLLRIAGIDLRSLTDQNTQRTSVMGGHALRDVTLDIERGSVVCLTGPSGSGKSVLLQVLAGATAPTSGRVEIYGTVSSLLGSGTRLDERASAEQNIRTSPEFEATAKDDRAGFITDVIDFAELHEFEHAPVRTFSTGMRLRLAIALVLCSRARILLIDDVLAVGDIAFQRKCIERVRDMSDDDRTIVAVFGDDAIVQQLASRIVTLADGRIVGDASPSSYARHATAGGAADLSWAVISGLPDDDAVALRALAVEAGRNGDTAHVDLAMSFDAKLDEVRCRPSIVLNRGDLNLFRALAPGTQRLSRGQRATWVVRIPTDMLPDGDYNVMVNMQSEVGDCVYAMKAHEAVNLHVRRPGGRIATDDDRDVPLFAVQFPCELEVVETGDGSSA